MAGSTGSSSEDEDTSESEYSSGDEDDALEEAVMSGLIILGQDRRRAYMGSVPLVSVDVKASVVHAVGQVEITQVYKNDRETPIETVYFLPLDSYAGVIFFQAEFDDGTVVKGSVKTKEEAAKEYKEAVKKQKTAFLGEQVKPDIFSLKVGHLNPGVQVKVMIGYVTEVKNDPDTSAMRFVLPTTVAPRYTPPGKKAISDGTGNEMEHTGRSAVPLRIDLAVSMQEQIMSVTSPTHEIVAQSCVIPPERNTGNWNTWSVTLESVITEMDRDLVVFVTPEDVSKPRLYTEVGEDGSLAVMAHFIPSFQLKEQKSEFVIVIDRSGSMAGNSIKLARQAVMLFLHSLPEDCYFNIVGFGSSFESLFPQGSRKYDEASLGIAMLHAEKLQANLGGTELVEPLLNVLSSPAVPEYVRQVFVITDGDVENTEEVIGLVKRHANQARVFSMGIGAAASADLVRGIARAGGGTSVFVESDDNIQKQTLSQLKNAMQPALSEVSVKWTGTGVSDDTESEGAVAVNTKKTLVGYNKPLASGKKQSEPSGRKYFQGPSKVPPIFDGSQLLVVGIFPKEATVTGVVITAVSPDGPLSLELKVDENCKEIQAMSMIHKLAALKVIQELEAEETYIIPSTRKKNNRSVQTKTPKQEITELGLKYGIASKHTSFIAVREGNQSQGNGLPVETIVIPNMMPRGSGQAPRKSVAAACTKKGQVPRKSCAGGGGSGRYKGIARKSTGGMAVRKRLTVKAARKSSPAVAPVTKPLSRNPAAKSIGQQPAKQLATKSTRKTTGEPTKRRNTEPDSADSSPVPRKSARLASVSVDVDKELLKLNLKSDADRMFAVVKLQSFTGSFKPTQGLCTIMGLSLDDILKEIGKRKWDAEAFMTCLAVAYLKIKLKSLKDQWGLVVTKGEKWLNKNFAGTGKVMMEEAEKRIRK